MKIELIPIIEIEYRNQGVTAPDKYPYWDNSEIWDNYHEECYLKAGFKDKLTPYLKGYAFYKLADISEENLKKLTLDHTQELRDGKYDREQACAFAGGYVLRVDNQDKYFPQCCGELSDITYWDNISEGRSSYHEEHPTPKIKFENNNIVFNFSVGEFDEPFQPPTSETILIVDRIELQKAVEKVKLELQTIEQRINKINSDENLSIENIGGLLIWDNANYE